jgi:ribosomal protein S18 acetylase RimI-like enzyme
VKIAEATQRHRDFVRKLASAVFARFGDYETMLPLMMRAPVIHTWIAEDRGRALGFVMLSTELAAAGECDLTAIAVLPEVEGRGIGRLLLEHAEREALARLPVSGPAAMRLTVAEDNPRARRFFESRGYRFVAEELDDYQGGQRAMTLRKSLRVIGA